jgi:predicted ATPase/DNA-binding SARP family transcriptional activator
MLEFRLLGALEVGADGAGVPLGSGKQRALLAYLLLHRNKAVTRDALVDALWGDEPPASAAHAVDVYVSRLRKALAANGGEGLLETHRGAFLLAVPDEAVDVGRFERLLAEARGATNPADRLAAADAAVALWRGPAFADVLAEPFARPESERLEEERLVASEERFEALLGSGRADEAIGGLQAFVATHPLRERPRRQLMLSLYRSGRQSEALEAYRDARRTLRDELGLDPSAALKALEAAILRQDPSLVLDLPQPRTFSSGNLPVPSTPFLGREREVLDVSELLSRDDVRLLTLIGPGGIGKTRLALRAAASLTERFPDGVWWVALTPLRDHRLVLETVAQVLQARQGLADHIGDRQLLLVLDNFEQVVEAAEELGALMQRCPRLRLLVTSREPLHLDGEWTYAVEPLRVPEAVDLFCQRAAAGGRELTPGDELEQICVRLDCLPLAIELAAARVTVLSPSLMLARLEQRLPVLSGGPRDAPERHRTLRATLDWSYELLSEPEQRVFVRLSVFAGGSTLEAAEDICETDLDTLHSLIDKSLVRRTGDRYWMLATIRYYATERLQESDEREAVARRHAEHFAAFAERAVPGFFRPDAAEWIDRLAADHDNLRAALAHAVDTGDGEILLRIAGALGRRFWSQHGDLREGRRWLEQALAASETPADARALALAAISNISGDLGDDAAQIAYAEAEISFATARNDPFGMHHGLWNLGSVALRRGDLDEAAAFFEESADYARAAGSSWAMAITDGNLAAVALERRDFEPALALSVDAAAHAEEAGDTYMQAVCLGNAATAALRLGRLGVATEFMRDTIRVHRTLSSKLGLFFAFPPVAAIAVALGMHEPAARLLGASQRLGEESGYVIDMIDAETAELTLERLRADLGERAEILLAQGRLLALDDAVACALAVLE